MEKTKNQSADSTKEGLKRESVIRSSDSGWPTVPVIALAKTGSGRSEAETAESLFDAGKFSVLPGYLFSSNAAAPLNPAPPPLSVVIIHQEGKPELLPGR